MSNNKCYGCEGGSSFDNFFGRSVIMCRSCGQLVQPLVGKRWPNLSPEHLILTETRQSWSFAYVEYAEKNGWQRGTKPLQVKLTSEICCPNSGCRKMNDADAKSCWWCSGRLVHK